MYNSVPFQYSTKASTNLVPVSAADQTAKIAGLVAVNVAAYDIFLKFYWSKQGEVPVVGTTVPDMTVGVSAPGTTITAGQLIASFDNPVCKMGQLWMWVTQLATAADTTATAAGDGIITLLLQ